MDTAIPVPLPLLETLSKINENAVKGCQRFLLNLCNISKMPQFQILLHPWEQKEVARSKVRQVQGVGHNHHFVFCQKGGVLLTLQRLQE